jgi:hypothetical protein
MNRYSDKFFEEKTEIYCKIRGDGTGEMSCRLALVLLLPKPLVGQRLRMLIGV